MGNKVLRESNIGKIQASVKSVWGDTPVQETFTEYSLDGILEAIVAKELDTRFQTLIRGLVDMAKAGKGGAFTFALSPDKESLLLRKDGKQIIIQNRGEGRFVIRGQGAKTKTFGDLKPGSVVNIDDIKDIVAEHFEIKIEKVLVTDLKEADGIASSPDGGGGGALEKTGTQKAAEAAAEAAANALTKSGKDPLTLQNISTLSKIISDMMAPEGKDKPAPSGPAKESMKEQDDGEEDSWNFDDSEDAGDGEGSKDSEEKPEKKAPTAKQLTSMLKKLVKAIEPIVSAGEGEALSADDADGLAELLGKVAELLGEEPEEKEDEPEESDKKSKEDSEEEVGEAAEADKIGGEFGKLSSEGDAPELDKKKKAQQFTRDGNVKESKVADALIFLDDLGLESKKADLLKNTDLFDKTVETFQKQYKCSKDTAEEFVRGYAKYEAISEQDVEGDTSKEVKPSKEEKPIKDPTGANDADLLGKEIGDDGALKMMKRKTDPSVHGFTFDDAQVNKYLKPMKEEGK